MNAERDEELRRQRVVAIVLGIGVSIGATIFAAMIVGVVLSAVVDTHGATSEGMLDAFFSAPGVTLRRKIRILALVLVPGVAAGITVYRRLRPLPTQGQVPPSQTTDST